MRLEIQSLRKILLEKNDSLIKEIETAMIPKINEMIETKIKDHAKETEKKYEERFRKLENEIKESKTSQKERSEAPSHTNLEKMT